MDKSTFIVKNKKNEDITCEVLLTFDSDETNKSYIIYTDNTYDEDGNKKTYAASYDPTKKETILKEIEDEKEYKVIEFILKEFQNNSEQ